MPETLTTTSDLPEAQDIETSRARYETDVKVLEQAAASTDGVEFEAQLPEVVGFIPESERALFGTLPGAHSRRWVTQWDELVIRDDGVWPPYLSGIREIIDEDVRNLGIADKATIPLASFDRVFTPKGETPGRISDIHTDGSNEPRGVFYLFANRKTTLFYAGPAYLTRQKGLLDQVSFEIKETSLDNTKPLVAAPDYAIVRCTGATIHVPPVFEEDDFRTLGRVQIRH